MRDYVHEHFARHPAEPGALHHVRPAIVCKDGTTYSVQASAYHYCSPRETGAERYTSVEVWRCTGRGIPNEPEGWARVRLINRRIRDHGGPVAE